MTARAPLHDEREPLAPWWWEPADPEGRRVQAFEITSRGDRVPGRLWLPRERSGRRPLVLVQHGAGGSLSSGYMATVCDPWVRSGAAVAAVDLPLHGARASAKLSERLLAVAADPAVAEEPDRGLWIAFLRQAVADLRRTLDLLSAHEEVDAARVGFAGLSLGSVVGALFCAGDPRVRAAALALGGGGVGPAEVDPVSHVGGVAPRPLLFVNALHDEHVPRARADALHAAAGEPKEVLWFEATHGTLPGTALKAMWQFLWKHLERPAA